LGYYCDDSEGRPTGCRGFEGQCRREVSRRHFSPHTLRALDVSIVLELWNRLTRAQPSRPSPRKSGSPRCARWLSMAAPASRPGLLQSIWTCHPTRSRSTSRTFSELGQGQAGSPNHNGPAKSVRKVSAFCQSRLRSSSTPPIHDSRQPTLTSTFNGY
jgi:hypothetical protein